MTNSSDSARFGTWLNTFANLAVVAGIVFLAVEIQQNTEMMQAQMLQARTETAVSEQQALYNSDHMPEIVVKVRTAGPLTDEERLRYEAWVRAFNRNMDNQLEQHDRELLGPNIPRSVRDGVREVIAASSLSIEVWEKQKIAYSDRYIAFVEEAIADLR